MKIAISADGCELTSKVAHRFGHSRYLIIIDPQTLSFEAVENQSSEAQSGVGIQFVATAIERKVTAVLAGYCSPTAESYLSANNIEVLTGYRGTVEEAVKKFREISLPDFLYQKSLPVETKGIFHKKAVINALKSSGNQLLNMLPIILGVVFLIGLVNTFFLKEFTSSIFQGNYALDSLMGACLGSIFAGNPINSYLIGNELQEYGVSLFTVTALIVSWVNVGIIQLPAETAAFGLKFALIRNIASFCLSIVIAICTVFTLIFFMG